MAPHSQEHHEAQLQSIIPFSLGGLYCEEERFEDDLEGFGFEEESEDCLVGNLKTKSLALFDQDLLWDDGELLSLLSKEKDAQLILGRKDLNSDGLLLVVRKEAVVWMLRVCAHYGFTPVTSVLAVNYFDRFISSLCLQRDKPWMGQLAAVACLSLAAKVEETQVPLLLDLQVEESKFVFEAKTIQRMELLVLSSLQWKMNPVTPFSFIDHITRRFRLHGNLQWEFPERCERLILSIISDSRFRSYPSSVIATATMLLVVQKIDPCNAMKYETQLMDILKISKAKTDDCYNFMLDSLDNYGCEQFQPYKRKYESAPGSPNGVMDVYFSCDSSNDSWDVSAAVSLSNEPLCKKIKTQHQQTRLAPLESVCLDLVSSLSDLI